jgi:pimeloyl-ACP methyl ester carboxylesterase
MSVPTSHYINILGREIHYMQWGDASKPPLIMWHGLARTGRDFDDLAMALSNDWHIIAPDTIGRGLSQWSPAPEAEYCNDFYAQLATGLLDALGFKTVDWVGTSMGGAIAIRAAAGPLKGRIRRLVLNDMGPKIASSAIERIRSYAGKPPRFDTMAELENYFRTIYKPYGWISDAGWRRMIETSMRRLPDGGITTHYDPNMVLQFTAHENDYDQWPQWDALTADVLCLRGADSDLLLPEDAEAMTKRGPRCRLVTIEGCGHAPALNVPEQTNLVHEFLKGGLV